MHTRHTSMHDTHTTVCVDACLCAGACALQSFFAALCFLCFYFLNFLLCSLCFVLIFGVFFSAYLLRGCFCVFSFPLIPYSSLCVLCWAAAVCYCALLCDLSLLTSLCVDWGLFRAEGYTQVTGVMAMMMTGRVLLVCALCVLWCVVSGIAAEGVGGGDGSVGEYYVSWWHSQLRRECAMDGSRRTGGRENASAVEECVRRGMDGVRVVVDGRHRWRHQRYALVAKDPDGGSGNDEDHREENDDKLRGLSFSGQTLQSEKKSSEGGAGGGTELGLEQPQPEEPSVTKNKELDVGRELMGDENKGVSERNVLVDPDLKDSKAMKVPANQPEVDALLLSSSDFRAADIPGGVSSELSSEVSRSSEASGKGGGDQQKTQVGPQKHQQQHHNQCQEKESGQRIYCHKHQLRKPLQPLHHRRNHFTPHRHQQRRTQKAHSQPTFF
ncbi:mucin-associated surface protein (MASP) [Trypanosoma cruzi Dm28c]|uniref:Mucin-associated surface protein (MASP) n=1 Tax=Trypanosoma cruzi Dm28c TaxID=1416333 RepID=V5BET9_TRYCR|nr:mucin-associated surface protein (MASP) [Trypanosoma cruzi Dm28c]